MRLVRQTLPLVSPCWLGLIPSITKGMEPRSSQWCKVGGQVTDIKWKKTGWHQLKVCILHITFPPTKTDGQRFRRLDQKSVIYLLTWIFLSSHVISLVSCTKRQHFLPVLHKQDNAPLPKLYGHTLWFCTLVGSGFTPEDKPLENLRLYRENLGNSPRRLLWSWNKFEEHSNLHTY